MSEVAVRGLAKTQDPGPTAGVLGQVHEVSSEIVLLLVPVLICLGMMLFVVCAGPSPSAPAGQPVCPLTGSVADIRC
jgi:hypothetical protein